MLVELTRIGMGTELYENTRALSVVWVLVSVYNSISM